MEEAKPKVTKYLETRITRRQAVKVGGVAALGLVFSKPIIETIRPTPAFASYQMKVGKPSIEWGIPGPQIDPNLELDDDGEGNDIELETDVAAATTYTVRASLCNVSDDTPVTIDDWLFTYNIVEGQGIISNVSFNPTAAGFPSLTAGPPDVCADLDVIITTSSDNWDKLKIEVFATGTVLSSGLSAGPIKLTITIEED